MIFRQKYEGIMQNQSNKQKWSFQSVVIKWLDCVLKEGESGEGTEL